MGKQTERQNQMETQEVTILHRNNTDEKGRIVGDCWKLTCMFSVQYSDYTPTWKQAYSYEVDANSIKEYSDEELDAVFPAHLGDPHTDCFRINNAVDGTDDEMPVKFQTRSLSVGDLVRIGADDYYFVDRHGYVKIDKSWLHQIGFYPHEIELDVVGERMQSSRTMAEGRN
jgi:hypothetical protein